VGGVGGRDIPPGSYPSLAYQVMVVPNAENALPGGTVLLPPLHPANARVYDGTRDVELTVEGVEGLKMLVKAGSMRRSDGSKPTPENPAILALNQVHYDSIPMPMPDGAAPPFAWTLQPAGAHFDPPVSIVYPNISGLPPGAISYFLSFNHDTHRFEIVATGRVSEDGSTIASDPGAGIRVAGWGGNCPPYSVTENVENDPCLSIEAEKVAGGAVSNGDLLCKNQGERIRLRAVYQPDECGEGPPQWSIDPPAAGSFEGGVDEGDEVIFVQADGYVSSAANDVVITAQLEGAAAKFRLTVFHVRGFSGELLTDSTKEFPSTYMPAALDPGPLSLVLNLFLAASGFRTRQFISDPARILQQPEVLGVIRSISFSPHPTRRELLIRVESAAQEGDVNIVIGESGQNFFHVEHMKVVKLLIGDVFRGDGLPFSLPPDKTHDVQVEISPSLSGKKIEFKVEGSNPINGRAEVTANANRTTSGPITIRGILSTSPGNEGRLKIVALIDGNASAESDRFSVCAHPSKVSFRFLNTVSKVIESKVHWGAVYGLEVESDSGILGDLNKTKVAENIIMVFTSGYIESLNLSTGVFESSTGAILDLNTFSSSSATLARGNLASYASKIGAGSGETVLGHQVDDQFFRFSCERCNIPEDINKGPKIPKSGFRHDLKLKRKLITSPIQEQFFVHTSKSSFANNGVEAGNVDDSSVKVVEIKEPPP
ncbi:MAG: hypothetical protein HY717_19220, partial [Planctomycetes bacterium]|nr:hypothetical protein [Planctomycetota bacterium]